MKGISGERVPSVQEARGWKGRGREEGGEDGGVVEWRREWC